MKQKKTFHLSLRRTWQLMTGGLSVVTLAALCWALCLSATLPDRYYLAKGSRFSLGDSSLIQTSSNDGYPLSVYSSTGNTFRMDLKLLGLINIKPVSVQVVDRRVVALCGTPFGIKMVTDGVMVVGTGAVTDCNSRAVSPAQTAGIQEGDIILSINGEKISSKKQLTKLVESSAGQPLSLVVRRGEQLTSLHLSPVRSSLDNSYHLGLWVRDSSAGIGTMTFYDPNNGCFAGLGHAICDVDTGQLMPLSQGEIVEASIIGVHAGKSGSPGQLQGAFVANRSIGSLYTNSYNGVYGRLMNQPVDAQTIPMAQCQEVRQGPVKILTTVSGQKPQLFDACIEKLSLSQDEPTKNMVLRITDPDLLELSGGIVQGMSGSPIIQDGMLVGAVTHV
ncbi:MAG: SpoIVB peptidase [Negativibacillus sp.]